MPRRNTNNKEIKISLGDSTRTVPYAAEVEKSLLGTMLTDPQCINKVLEMIKDENIFYSPANQKIFSAIKDFTVTNKPEELSLAIIAEKLRERNQLEDIGDYSYLLELTKFTESSEKIESMCKILIEKYMARRIIQHALKIATKGFDGTIDVFDLLNEAEAGFFEISEHKYKKTFLSLAELTQRTIYNIEKVRNKEYLGIPTGYDTFDALLGGFQASDLIIIAARPGVGKTAFGLSLTYNIAKYHNKSVGFFSLEMKSDQIVTRLLSQESRINVFDLRIGKISQEYENKLALGIRKLSNLKVFIDDTPAISLHELRAKARRMITEKNVEIIFVDYLQLMQGPSNVESREREISYISRGLKALAKELDIPVVALAQLNRQVEMRQSKKPMLSDLRESGAIEQDADIVCFLHRLEKNEKDENSNEQEPFRPREIEVIIAKQRNGPTGSFTLLFLPTYARFENKTEFNHFEQID